MRSAAATWCPRVGSAHSSPASPTDWTSASTHPSRRVHWDGAVDGGNRPRNPQSEILHRHRLHRCADRRHHRLRPSPAGRHPAGLPERPANGLGGQGRPPRHRAGPAGSARLHCSVASPDRAQRRSPHALPVLALSADAYVQGWIGGSKAWELAERRRNGGGRLRAGANCASIFGARIDRLFSGGGTSGHPLGLPTRWMSRRLRPMSRPGRAAARTQLAAARSVTAACSLLGRHATRPIAGTVAGAWLSADRPPRKAAALMARRFRLAFWRHQPRINVVELHGLIASRPGIC